MQATRKIKGVVSTTPELSVTPSGKPNTKFNLDVQGFNREIGVPETVQVHVVTWNVLADNTSMYVTIGANVELTGRWETRDYTDKNGQPRQWTEFIAFELRKDGILLKDDGFARASSTMLPDAVTDITPAWKEDNGEPGQTAGKQDQAADRRDA